MATNRKTILTLIAVMACAVLLMSGAFATSGDWETPGNTDLNIQNGGTMLLTDDTFYYSEHGIYAETTAGARMLTAEDGANLNLRDGALYYTLSDGQVRRLPLNGGEAETVYTHTAPIKQMYVIGEELRFLAEGRVYALDLDTGSLEPRGSLTRVMKLIPTEYGDICLTGEVLDYDLYVGGLLAFQQVTGAYTDSGYLVLNQNGQDYQAALGDLFAGDMHLEDFDLHGDEDFAMLMAELGEEECPVCAANAEAADTEVSLMTVEDDGGEKVIPEVSQGQRNMVLRARQLHEIEWTPLEARTQWGYRGTFQAGVAVSGLAYGQPVNNGGYVGYNVSLEQYAAAVVDNTSKFYTTYSTYNKIAPAYSTDCSGFVSYAWDLKYRTTTYGWSNVATKVSDQSIYSLQVGDALNHTTSHIVMVEDVKYDADGNMVQVTIIEQTPVKTKRTVYGEGGSYALSRIQSYYLNGGYALYRLETRDDVKYTHSCAVPLDGETCSNCYDPAPFGSTAAEFGKKTLTLQAKHGGAIYYTTDGSTPTTRSSRYTGPLSFTETTTVKAIEVTGNYNNHQTLTYQVAIPPVSAPKGEVESGLASGNLVASGSKIKLTTATSGATLYYTTDGSTPTTSSTKYTGPISISRDTTIKVIGVAPGCTQSSVTTLNYQIGQVYTITASAGNGGSISPSGTTQVLQTGSRSFAISPSSGYEIADVQVDGVSKGKISSYTFSNVTGNHSISATFKVKSVNLPFTDVSQNQWFVGAVNFVYTKDLFKGMTETTFEPDISMTRGMFITVLGRLAGVEEFSADIGIVTGSDVRVRSQPSTESGSQILAVLPKYAACKVLGSTSAGGYTWYQVQTGTKTGYIRGDYFKPYTGGLSDMGRGQYYNGYTQWAYLTGILDGAASGSFNGESAISREDMALILYNYCQKYGVSLNKTNDKVTFSDDSSIGSAAKRTAVYALQQAGVIDGMGDGTYAPKSSATRAQVAQIFWNYSTTQG